MRDPADRIGCGAYQFILICANQFPDLGMERREFSRHLHKQHVALIGDRNILKLRLPLVRVPQVYLHTAFTFSMVVGFS